MQHHTILRLQRKSLIISFSLPDPWGSFSVCVYASVPVLCGRHQAPGRASLTGLFIGDLLPALKYTESGVETVQHCGNNVIPVLHASAPFCWDLCPGSCPARLCAGGLAPCFVHNGAACALKLRFLQEWKYEILRHVWMQTDAKNKAQSFRNWLSGNAASWARCTSGVGCGLKFTTALSCLQCSVICSGMILRQKSWAWGTYVY